LEEHGRGNCDEDWEGIVRNVPKQFGIGAVTLAIMLVVAGPFLVLWAVNVLLGTAIDYNWQTWIATVILLGAAKAVFSDKKLDK
jgi:hypothetical protein|tara:strand:+ start:87 stop:338 length:252 start_codon:yes stop_codon:yes gene_type:complete